MRSFNWSNSNSRVTAKHHIRLHAIDWQDNTSEIRGKRTVHVKKLSGKSEEKMGVCIMRQWFCRNGSIDVSLGRLAEDW